MQIVKDKAHLFDLLKDGVSEFSIALKFGGRSSKHIELMPDNRLYINNYIDGSEFTIKQNQLFDESITNIGKALTQGALYYEL